VSHRLTRLFSAMAVASVDPDGSDGGINSMQDWLNGVLEEHREQIIQQVRTELSGHHQSLRHHLMTSGNIGAFVSEHNNAFACSA